MSKEKELQDAFKGLIGRKAETFAVKVLSVDKKNGSCKVSDEELEYTDVRLTSVLNSGKERFFLYPAVGSSILVAPINEDLHQLHVIAYGEIENWSAQVGTTKWNFDKDGVAIERQGESLKKVLNDYIDEMNKIIVVNGTTVNVAATTIIKERLNRILK